MMTPEHKKEVRATVGRAIEEVLSDGGASLGGLVRRLFQAEFITLSELEANYEETVTRAASRLGISVQALLMAVKSGDTVASATLKEEVLRDPSEGDKDCQKR